MIRQKGVIHCPYCGGPSGRWSAEGYWELAPEDQIIYPRGLVCCIICASNIEYKWLSTPRTSQDLLLAINHTWCVGHYAKMYKDLLEHIQ